MLKLEKYGVNESIQAYSMLILTTFCWGLNAVFARMAAGEISPMLLVSIRWLGTLILLVLFARRTIIEGIPAIRQQMGYTFSMGLVGLGGFGTLIYYSAYYTTALNIGIIQGAMPAIVLVGSCWFFRTSVNFVQIAGVAITMLGVVFVSINGELEKLMSLSLNKGDLLMLIAVLLYGAYTVGLRRKHNLSSILLFASVVVWAFISTLPLTIYEFASGKTVWPEEKVWIIVGLIVLLPSFLSQICFIASVKLIGPARSGVFVNLVPVFASLLAVQLLGEAFELYHGLSLFLVLSGIYIFERYKSFNS
ncbi:DMT family transporter [Deltaproteobacteria bacterium]|nr:DMT family transporter [Deltaproteobacteria bacterium]